MSARLRARSAAWALATFGAAVGLSGGCARQARPPGGPIDDTAPSVTRTLPTLNATQVALDAPLVIEFSESVNRSRSEDAVVVRPAVDWASRSWVDHTLTLVPDGGWRTDTTYSVLLRTGIVDARDIAMKSAALVVFSTGPDVLTGRVSGTVRRLGVSAGPTLVFAFASAVDDTADVPIDAAVAVAEPDASGKFLLAGLPIGQPLEVGAFYDVNENRAFDGARDLYCRSLTPVIPDSGGGPYDVDIALVFHDTPGSIRAVVIDSTCVRLDALRRRGTARRDSLFSSRDSLLALKQTWEARADSLNGAAVAPVDETASDTVITPDDGGPAVVEASRRLRSTADSLRTKASALTIPDSTSIAALAYVGDAARDDSLYCRAPLGFEFKSVSDTTSFSDIAYDRSDFDVSDVPPGAYRGVVWRDVVTDERYDRDAEPGHTDSITIWVPPGAAGIVDTLWLHRRASTP